METNYTDERFDKVEADKQGAMAELDQTYDGMIESSDQYYEAQINASKEWADKQSQLQKENTDFTIEQIEQQKEQAQKDYTKEQSGAYVDWQKQTAQHGVNAEQMAVAGLAGSGYSESSKVSMYNTYQNRVATAREAYSRAVLNYDNAIKEARLQNNSALAEIAYQALQQQLELSLQGFQYKNQLILDKASKRTELDNIYYGRYMDVLNQINYEKEFAEQVRQFEASYGLQAAQLAEDKRQFDMEYEESVRQFNEEIARLKADDESANALKIQQLELQKAQLEEEKRQFDIAVDMETENGMGGGIIDKTTTDENSSNEVNNAYYQGPLNSDANVYGTFSNGYQPRGISGHGVLAESGKTIFVETIDRYGNHKEGEQNVWKATDGTLWYWDGRQNKYMQINVGANVRNGSGGGGWSGGGRISYVSK